ncbi:hypothetical protein KIW84_050964 [Lathyrus oleraceus]|uniref:Uncharacterized protein n=1 Tax=Pisum sativum TaxID=3888 RepID=A0A9D4WIU6_PEA|nr:hypothetical protein KIW84_050964 [Pisum sativum]
MEVIKRTVMEVDEPSVKKKSAKKNGNVNSRLTTTGITMVAAKNLEIAASNHFPRMISKKYLQRNQKEIKLVDVEAGKTFKCVVYTVTRKNKSNVYEKYMAQQWYEYAAKKKVYDGDVLVLKMGSYSPYFTPSYHPTSPKDSTKESTNEVYKPIEEMQKDHTSDSDHGDEKEKNAHVEGEVDKEMHNVATLSRTCLKMALQQLQTQALMVQMTKKKRIILCPTFTRSLLKMKMKNKIMN